MGARREPIFDVADRHDRSPGQHGESTFDFLNRVAGDYWDHPRQLVQEWADRIDDPHDYNDLRQRFRCRDDEQFRSAFLELYLHESLLRAGYAVTIHPDVPGTTRRPDFRAERDGQLLYAEAIAPGATPEAKAAARRRAVLLDTVNGVADPNFMLYLLELKEGDAPPASARLRRALRRWLAELDPDTVPDLEHAPEWRWEHQGWAVSFKPIPLPPQMRGVDMSDRRAIGVYGHMPVEWIDDAPAIRKALASKHHEYGDLGAPFIVAVGTYIHDKDRWHSGNALYGQVAVQISETPTGETRTREIRQPNGYFGVPPEWRNENVSGVLLVNQLMPYHFHRAEVTLWRHPSPLYPLPPVLGLPVDTLELRGTTLVETPANPPAREFFGLPDPWPPVSHGPTSRAGRAQ